MNSVLKITSAPFQNKNNMRNGILLTFPCAYIPSKKPNVSLDMNFIKRCVLYALHEENEGKEKDKKKEIRGNAASGSFFKRWRHRTEFIYSANTNRLNK